MPLMTSVEDFLDRKESAIFEKFLTVFDDVRRVSTLFAWSGKSSWVSIKFPTSFQKLLRAFIKAGGLFNFGMNLEFGAIEAEVEAGAY